MPNKYLERFNTLLGRSKGEAAVAKMSREELVEEWWNEVSKQKGHGKYNLTDIMNTFNIATLGELDKLLGYKHPGASSHFLQHAKKVTYDIKHKYYSFFENELNIQPVKKTEVKPNVKIDNRKQDEIFDWWNSFDFKKWYDENNISRQHICKSTKISTGTLSNLYRRKFDKPTISVLYRLKDYVDEVESVNPVLFPTTFTSVPVEEVPEDVKRVGQELVREVNENMKLQEKLTEKYKYKVEEIQSEINKRQCQIEKLEEQKRFYEQILIDINED